MFNMQTVHNVEISCTPAFDLQVLDTEEVRQTHSDEDLFNWFGVRAANLEDIGPWVPICYEPEDLIAWQKSPYNDLVKLPDVVPLQGPCQRPFKGIFRLLATGPEADIDITLYSGEIPLNRIYTWWKQKQAELAAKLA